MSNGLNVSTTVFFCVCVFFNIFFLVCLQDVGKRVGSLLLEAALIFSADGNAMWESGSGLGPLRKPPCHFGELDSKSPLMKYQPKISLCSVFSQTLPDFLNGSS